MNWIDDFEPENGCGEIESFCFKRPADPLSERPEYEVRLHRSGQVNLEIFERGASVFNDAWSIGPVARLNLFKELEAAATNAREQYIDTPFELYLELPNGHTFTPHHLFINELYKYRLKRLVLLANKIDKTCCVKSHVRLFRENRMKS